MSMNDLGPHQISLCTALNDINMNSARASDPVEDITKRFVQIADVYQDLINSIGVVTI